MVSSLVGVALCPCRPFPATHSVPHAPSVLIHNTAVQSLTHWCHTEGISAFLSMVTPSFGFSPPSHCPMLMVQVWAGCGCCQAKITPELCSREHFPVNYPFLRHTSKLTFSMLSLHSTYHAHCQINMEITEHGTSRQSYSLPSGAAWHGKTFANKPRWLQMKALLNRAIKANKALGPPDGLKICMWNSSKVLMRDRASWAAHIAMHP